MKFRIINMRTGSAAFQISARKDPGAGDSFDVRRMRATGAGGRFTWEMHLNNARSSSAGHSRHVHRFRTSGKQGSGSEPASVETSVGSLRPPSVQIGARRGRTGPPYCLGITRTKPASIHHHIPFRINWRRRGARPSIVRCRCCGTGRGRVPRGDS